MFVAVTTKQLNTELRGFRFKALLTLAAVTTKQLNTELRIFRLEMLLTLDAGKKGCSFPTTSQPATRVLAQLWLG